MDMNSQGCLNTNLVCLQRAVLCVNCEVISEGNNAHCDACGSQALLNLNKLLNGSHKSKVTFHLPTAVRRTNRAPRSLAVSETVVRTDVDMASGTDVDIVCA